MTRPEPVLALPFAQAHPLRPVPLLLALRQRGPIHRIRTRAGHEAWLVTGYEQVRMLLADARIGRSHREPERAARASASALFGGRPRENYSTEDADRAWFRKTLHTVMSPARLRELRPWVDTLVTTLLDELAAADQPADFHERVAVKLPTMVICKLLGVPPTDLPRLREFTEAIADADDEQRSATGLADLTAYLHDLMARGEVDPDGLVGKLRAARNGLSDGVVAQLAASIMFTGHETTVVAIGYGTLLLLTNPDQCQAVRDDPAKLPAAVEECLRVGNLGVNTGGNGFPCYARADIDLAGAQIRAGDLLLLDTGTANHDDGTFPDPYRFHIDRPSNPHLTFGHGRHYCAGAGLARLEMESLFAQLLPRFPTLRLAVRVEDLRSHGDLITGGLVALPVAW